MNDRAYPLYERLPEIYRIRDAEQSPPGQLEALVRLVERAFGEIHADIEGLYEDLFIETCNEWVVPYIGDLLGTSHLAGDEWTRRVDVADTIALRRRKGTLAAITRLTHDLTGWGVHAVELRERMLWNHHLNHPRPDGLEGQPHTRRGIGGLDAPRGGTVAVRDPALLELIGSPFDPFAHVADLRPRRRGAAPHNLPNLAIFLWRLETYRVPVAAPVVQPDTPEVAGVHLVRATVDPLGRPVQLFNTAGADPLGDPPSTSDADDAPGPIRAARLHSNRPFCEPSAYLAVDVYDPTDPDADRYDIADVGLTLHVPAPEFHDRNWPSADGPSAGWRIRGADLEHWEACVRPAPEAGDIVVDPERGRLLIAVDTAAEASALREHLRVTYTYGAVGPVGAHPFSRDGAPDPADATVRHVGTGPGQLTLEEALADTADEELLVVEIQDSGVHDLDLEAVPEIADDPGGKTLALRGRVVIRGAAGERPIVRLARPLRARALDPSDAAGTGLRLERLFITPGDDVLGGPLIERAALDRLDLLECTLDPVGYREGEDRSAGDVTALRLTDDYGFGTPAEADAFDQVPVVHVYRCITGPLRLGRGYSLELAQSIVDAGQGVGDEEPAYAVASPAGPAEWGPPTAVDRPTVLGRMRVESIDGSGGIWVHALEVLNNQIGCIRRSYFSGEPEDRLPQNLGCVRGVPLRFTSQRFGDPAYGQLAAATARAVREEGPGDDAMGAFGFLQEAHRWRNLSIRYREFMPVGVRPVLIPVT